MPYQTFGKDYKPSMSGYTGSMKGYTPTGSSSASPAPAFNASDPSFMAFHGSNIAQSGGERSMGGSTLPRKMKFQGGPFKGMTQAEAMQSSITQWQALSPAERAKFGTPSSNSPATPSQGAAPMAPTPAPSFTPPSSLPTPTTPADAAQNFQSIIKEFSPSTADQKPATLSNVVNNVTRSFNTPTAPTPPSNGAVFRSPSLTILPSGASISTTQDGSKKLQSGYGTGSATFRPVTPTAPTPAPAPTAATAPAPTPSPVQVAQQNLSDVRSTNAALTPWQSTQQPPLMPGTAPFSPANQRQSAPVFQPVQSTASPVATTAAPARAPAPPAAAPSSVPDPTQQATQALANAQPGYQQIAKVAQVAGTAAVQGAGNVIGGAARAATFVPRVQANLAQGAVQSLNQVGESLGEKTVQGYQWLTQGNPNQAARARWQLRNNGRQPQAGKAPTFTATRPRP